jgi:hypothetical protein
VIEVTEVLDRQRCTQGPVRDQDSPRIFHIPLSGGDRKAAKGNVAYQSGRIILSCSLRDSAQRR